MTNLNLTEKEDKMLSTFVREGLDCCGFEGMKAESLINDNMTFMNANDLKAELGWNKQEIGGVMSALDAKGLIADTWDSPRGAKINDWTATDEAINWYFDEKGGY